MIVATSGFSALGDDQVIGAFTIPGVVPRAADADAPLAEGWPRATKPGIIEVKSYPAYRGAVARGKDASMGSDNILFYPLFLHITRSNVAMTSPVVNTFEPRMIEKLGATGDVAMEFVYRTPEAGPPGRGVGPVVVEDHPASSFACLGIQGDLGPERLQAATVALREWIERHEGEWVACGNPRRLGYHPPMIDKNTRLWEIQIPVRKVDKSK